MKTGIGVATAIVRGDRLLLGRRISRFGGGLWQTPGGKPDPGETLWAAAIRETFEETGLVIEGPVEIARQFDEFDEIATRYETVFFAVRGASGEPRNSEPDKCEGWSWHALADLPADRFAIDLATIEAIRAFAAASSDETLESERLRLEPIVAAHAPALFDGLQDPALYPYLAADPPTDIAELAERYAFLERRRSPDDSEGWLNWVIFEREGEAALGYVQATLRFSSEASLGYVLFTAHQGRGFAREAVARVVCDLANRGVRTVFATADTRNEASIALLEALGFERFRTVRSDDVLQGERGYDHGYRLALGATRMAT